MLLQIPVRAEQGNLVCRMTGRVEWGMQGKICVARIEDIVRYPVENILEERL